MNSIQTGAPRCARHPNVETYLKCACCGTPICPECFVHTPVGIKCRDCGQMANTRVFQLSLGRALAVVGVGLAGGLLAGAVLTQLGLWGILLGIPYGQLVGALILRVSGRKIGLLVDLLTGVSIILGGLIVYISIAVMAFYAWSHMRWGVTPVFWRVFIDSLGLRGLFALITIGVVAAAAISRIRLSWDFWRR